MLLSITSGQIKGSNISLATNIFLTIPLGFCFITVGTMLLRGLPSFYHRVPGSIPVFYKSLLKRPIVLWFFAATFAQSYFLGPVSARNWQYLWSSKHVSSMSIFQLLFISMGLWIAIIYRFANQSRQHVWILPIFSFGLIGPRWAQMLWGVSRIGLYLPWAGSPALSAILGRFLWLWLGGLDMVQGVGTSVGLMQTMPRQFVMCASVIAQVIGSAAMMAARATGPNKIGPGSVFPDLSKGVLAALEQPWFVIVLFIQFALCAGWFWWYRAAQLQKP